MNTIDPHAPHILIEIGKINQIIGTPGYGHPTMKVDIKGMDGQTALNLITELQKTLLDGQAKEMDALRNRIQELTKLNIEK